jgi:uncharacterized protein (DUF697 family)
MAGIDAAKKFWKTTKEMSVGQVAQAAQRPFSIAIVGTPEKRAVLLHRLFPEVGEDEVVPERSLVKAFDSTSTDVGFPVDAGPDYLVIDAGGGRALAPINSPIYSVDEMGGMDRVLERVLDQRPELMLSMARRFPGLRPQVAQRIINDTALANAEFAMLNAIPGVIPIVAPLLPAVSLGDIFMLTKNQAMMLYKLAAIHELPLDLRSRSKDMAPLLGNAFGWRAIARELVGMAPGGVGLVAKGAIAYAGTVALGKALERLYETGQVPTKAAVKELYDDAMSGAKEISRGILRSIRKRARKPVPAIEAADEEAVDS